MLKLSLKYIMKIKNKLHTKKRRKRKRRKDYEIRTIKINYFIKPDFKIHLN